MHTNKNEMSETSTTTLDRIAENAAAGEDDGLLPTDIGPGEEGADTDDGDGDDDDGDDPDDDDGDDEPGETEPSTASAFGAFDDSGGRTDNETAESQDSGSVVQRLMKENEELRTRARKYATFGDFLLTIAMLPLTSEKSTKAFKSRVDAALMMHGLPPNSPIFDMIAAGFVNVAGRERERILRTVTEITKLRISMKESTTTPHCTCVLCQSIKAAEIINQDGGKPDERRSLQVAQHDHFLTKDLRKTSTAVEADQIVQDAHDLMDLLKEMGGQSMGGAGSSAVLDLLMSLMGGDPGSLDAMARMPGRPSGIPGMPGVHVLTMGPDGTMGPNGLPPELAELLGLGDPENGEPDPDSDEPPQSEDTPPVGAKKRGLFGRMLGAALGSGDEPKKKRPAARAPRSPAKHSKHDGHGHD